MHKVSVLTDRVTAERLSTLLADMDPSPAAAVSTEEVTRTQWRLDAFCHDNEDAEACATIIETDAPGLSASCEALEDKDWVAESLKGLPAVVAGPYYVAGAHELGRLNSGKIPVWIEAGPAFGTGHHGTTKGCLEALARINRRHPIGKVLDIGTGSGVLAIAAMKSGGTLALASDIDAESVRIAKINAHNNRMDRRLHLFTANGARNSFIQKTGPYDLVMANILARPLIGLSKDLTALTRHGGHIILSGLLRHQEPLVRLAFSGRGLTLIERTRLGAWSTLVFRKPKPSAETSTQCAARRASRAARRVSRRGRLPRRTVA